MIVKENVLPANMFNYVKNRMTDIYFPWYISETSFGEKQEFYKYSFAHSVFNKDDGANPSFMFDLLYSCLFIGLHSIGKELDQLYRIRTGLIPGVPSPYVNAPHVDYEVPHYNALLYFTTCDAPTVIYNETYDYNCDKPQLEYQQKFSEFTIKEKCDSVENKFCFFDGKYYHSSTMPADVPRRIIVNYNFTIKS